jgi:hypothetical protein
MIFARLGKLLELDINRGFIGKWLDIAEILCHLWSGNSLLHGCYNASEKETIMEEQKW